MDAKTKKHLLLGDMEDHFLIDDGEVQFKVAKYMIDPRTKKKIEQMERHQNFACGGQVKGYADGGVAEEYVPENIKPGSGTDFSWLTKQIGSAPSPEALKKYGSVDEAMKAEQFYKEKNVPDVAVAPKEPVYSAPVGPKAPQDPSAEMAMKPKGIGIPQAERQIAGPPSPDPMQQMAAAGQDYTQSVQSAANMAKKSYDDAYNALKKSEDHYRVKRDQLDSRITALQDEISSGRIDPNRYWNDKSTPNKILSAFAIALGGFGESGKNGAMDVINKQIDADIDAQKANLKNKESLLSKNIELLGDMRLAEDATRAQINAGLAAQLGKFNYSMLGPKARMEQAELQAKLMMASKQMNESIARASAVKSLEGFGQSAATPEELSLAGDEYKKKAVRLPGEESKYLSAITPESSTQINTQLAQNKSIDDTLKKIEEVAGSAAYSLVTRDRVQKLMRGLEIQLAERKGASKSTERVLEMIRDMLDDPRDWKNLAAISSAHASQDLKDELANETENLMQQFIPGYKKPAKAPK